MSHAVRQATSSEFPFRDGRSSVFAAFGCIQHRPPPSPPPSSVVTASTTLAPGNAPNSGGGDSEDDADGGVSDGLIGGIVGGIIVLAAVVLAAGIGVGVYCAKKKARLASTATPASAVSTPVAVTVR